MKQGESKKEKEMIRRKFSRAADGYDNYAMIQRKCASHLLETLPSGFRPDSILEIGCGSGNYSRLLKEKYPGAAVTALDFSEEMLNIARQKTGGKGISFFTREAENYLVQAEKRFSLITSNATLQWFKDLSGAFANMAKILEEDGIIHVSVFGPGSLTSLGKALREVVDSSIILPSEKFTDSASLREAASSHFDHLEIEELNFDRNFHSFLELLRQIHNTGTGGFMDKTPRFTKSIIGELDKYLESQSAGHTGSEGFTVSYQVYFLSASLSR
ncbi:MAG: methyltransferase domain-containing protein [Desulfurivibrionaceae bacterium]